MRPGSRRISSVSMISSAETMTFFDASADSSCAMPVPKTRAFPYWSACCTWMIATSGFSAGTSVIGWPVNGSSTSFAPEYSKPSVPPNERTGRNGRPIAPACRRSVMTMLLYSYTAHPAIADGVVDRRARPEEAAVHLRYAPGADEQPDVHVRELAAQPEVLLLLPDHLADQRRGAALEVVAVVDEVVAVGHESRDRLATRTSAAARAPAACDRARTRGSRPDRPAGTARVLPRVRSSAFSNPRIRVLGIIATPLRSGN